MASKSKEKREGLELFVSEQIIGPGAFNKRFFLLEKWGSNEFHGKNLDDCNALDNVSEVISEVPAYQYSSAILFPISKTRNSATTVTEAANDLDDIEIEELNSQMERADDENFQDDQTESASSKNQNYPNTCGLSFAIREDSDLSKDLKISVNFRVYQKLKQKECKEQKLGYWVHENKDQIQDNINRYFSHVFEIEKKDSNLFVILKPNISITEYLYKIDYIFLNNFVKEVVLTSLAKSISNPISVLKEDDGKIMYGLKGSKEIGLYTMIKTNQRGNETFNDTITLHEDNLIDYFKQAITKDRGAFKSVKTFLEIFEVFNQLKEIVTEIKTIYRESSKRNRPTPIWESKLVSKEITLPKFSNTKQVERDEVRIDTERNLSLSYQYLRHKNRNIYVKLIIVNKNIIELEPDEPPQLNKKDDANKISFFGIILRVTEKSKSILVPYNPPNLLDIDEEDNFNKLIYRQYKDYGEGYNTSVSWGHSIENNELKFVSTEFLPKQETPKVDFTPSRKSEGKVISRINEKVLSMKQLSTLSAKTDKEVLTELGYFISEYKVWIEEKREELSADTSLLSGKDVLIKQLRACEGDYSRLVRNISLLEKDSKAIAAFRVMNTAMFMQLHHSVEVRQAKKSVTKPFIPNSNNEDYYQSLDSSYDYKWRSFQLAFILLNLDGFIKPTDNDKTVKDVFGTGWQERNEIADLVWFPTGGGKTEAYLGIIAFLIVYRRFTKGKRGLGTTVLMRYTLRLLTLQQFQRATILICALEVLRKDSYSLPNQLKLGDERITIGLFVGSDSAPNKWKGNPNRPGMVEELRSIKAQIEKSKKIATKLPHTECPWCGGDLFVDVDLSNIYPNPKDENNYKIDDKLRIQCNSKGCTFYDKRPTDSNSLPLRLFDEDIYKFPPTLLFGTVDKFAAIANKVSTVTNERNHDSRRLFGKGKNQDCLPPELIIQDELHLLLGPLGSAVGLFEKAIDELCSYTDNGKTIRPKIITSTATTRNTDKQIFALFNRRSEVFPKQGINCDDSFFAYYQRQSENIDEYESNRKYVGLLPVGKTQVWMQLRVTSIALVHRVRFIKTKFTYDDIFLNNLNYRNWSEALDYYHTVLSYFNSLKEVGKTQSQLSHYLPGDVNLVSKNTMPWNFIDKVIRSNDEIDYSELTGRLSGEQVKTSLSRIEKQWELLAVENPPEYVISTNMISVGIDVSRFNTMIVNSMPRNTAEYIQASSRVARDKEGIVFTVHHPFRSRDISHYQRFKEFHEKFYGYVEPISVTPFASKALERYLAMYMAALIRHDQTLNLSDNNSARNITEDGAFKIRDRILKQLKLIEQNAKNLNSYLSTRDSGVNLNIDGIIGSEELQDIASKVDELLIERWLDRMGKMEPPVDLVYRDDVSPISLFSPNSGLSLNDNWNVKQSLREIAPSVVIKTVQQ